MQHQIIEVTNAAFIPHVRTLIKEGRTVRFRAMGWSMRPMIEHARDEVLLGGYTDTSPQLHDVVLAEVDKEHYVLHRIMQIEGDRYTLQGDGNVCGIAHAPTSLPRPLPSIAKEKPSHSTRTAVRGVATPAFG